MSKAIRIHEIGGPEVLRLEEITLGAPAPGEARVRHHAIGVNYTDIYLRTGTNPWPLPTTLGFEGAGIVEEVAPDVEDIRPGDRVAYASMPIGAYCEVRNIPADRLVKLPHTVSFDQAAAMMLQGMTVQYLIRRTYKVQPGDFVLWHAAAGGVGSIACQWLAALGAITIGTVSSDEKARIAKACGCHHVIIYTRDDFLKAVKEITDGKGVPVVYDAVGKDTFDRSLECLRPFGMMVSFGNASGPVPPLDFVKALRGSLYLTRPTLWPYTARREDLLATARELFDVVVSGRVKINVTKRYPLEETAEAHRDMESRKTTGSVVLLP
ncbi:MAG: quinone oxidoreductase [Hyphomicrobiales bacterium]|nr:quinone oxidoreductase [Hyphomicrobiales bacterium]